MSAASARYAQNVISNAQYANYYSSMRLAATDGQDISNEVGDAANNKIPAWVHEQGKAVRALRTSAMTGLAGLSVLTAGIDESDQGMKLLRNVLSAAMIAAAIYSTLKGIYLARTAIETVIATAEATAAAVAQNWYALAVAGIAMAATYAAFSSTSSQTIISSADVSTAQGRREAQMVLRGVASGG